ncbi:cyclophilin-like domain-containing protein [Hysterangium stoloniferum]|nr:cyclophilin-like domain-containing protein [Hysterangium stoloniferum]
MTTAFLDVYIGDKAEYDEQSAAYERTNVLLTANYEIYGLPSLPEELSEEQREILTDLNRDKASPLRFAKPPSLLAGRLVFSLDPAAGLAKTRTNFLTLCRGDKGMCKHAPNKPLHYLGSPVHRIVRGFIAQGGDVTRGDGSGGESIYGGKFNDEKDGLKKEVKMGSLAMANSGKNSNSSQFFVVLANDSASWAKLKGKYVVFGEVIEGMDVLDKLDAVGASNGVPVEKVWIGGCGVLG